MEHSTFGHLRALWPQLESGDERAVHEARKLTRRAQAELRVAGAPRKVARPWATLRRQLSEVRDRDAAGEHLRAALAEQGASKRELSTFGRSWAAQREQARSQAGTPALPPAYALPGRWKKKVRQRLRKDRGKLLDEGRALLQATGSPANEAWHTWRKHLKRYRYTAELSGKPPGALLNVLNALGRLQDAHTLTALLEADPGLLPKRRAALLQREVVAAEQARAEVRRRFAKLARHLAAN